MEHVFAVDLQSLAPSPSVTSFGVLATTIVRDAFVLAGVISFIFLVIGGFGVVFGAGSGDPKSMEGSKQKITYAVIGLIIVITSYWLVQIIGKITGVDLLNPGV